MPDSVPKHQHSIDDVTELKKELRRLKGKDDIFWSKYTQMRDRVIRMERKLKIRNMTED